MMGMLLGVAWGGGLWVVRRSSPQVVRPVTKLKIVPLIHIDLNFRLFFRAKSARVGMRVFKGLNATLAFAAISACAMKHTQ
jgi:hypothetical protein